MVKIFLSSLTTSTWWLFWGLRKASPPWPQLGCNGGQCYCRFTSTRSSSRRLKLMGMLMDSLGCPWRVRRAWQSLGKQQYSTSHTLPVTHQQVQKATHRDPILSKVLLYTKKGRPDQIPEALKPFSTRRHKLTMEGEFLLWGIGVLVPKKLQSSILQELHRDHLGVSRIKALARRYVWWPGLDKDIEHLVKSCLPCQSVKQARQ